MATYNNVDKSDTNALYLIGIMKDVISDVRKQDSNKTSNDKSKSKDGKKNSNNANIADATNTNNSPTWEELEKVLTTYTYHIAALIKDSKSETEVEINELRDENKNLKKKLVTKSFDLEKLQQYQNRDIIKICGVSEPNLGPRDHENTNQTVKDVFSKLNNTVITDQDISVTHRIKSKTQQAGKPKAILFKATRRD